MSVLAASVLAAGALIPLVTGTASASSYTMSDIERCVYTNGDTSEACLELDAYTTNTSSQIWINGKVGCGDLFGDTPVTWCGVGGGNGTGTLNIGVNFTFAGVTGLYERMNITAGGGCSTWGSNKNGLNWFNAEVVCKT
jgi:hypothetical protein